MGQLGYHLGVCHNRWGSVLAVVGAAAVLPACGFDRSGQAAPESGSTTYDAAVVVDAAQEALTNTLRSSGVWTQIAETERGAVLARTAR